MARGLLSQTVSVSPTLYGQPNLSSDQLDNGSEDISRIGSLVRVELEDDERNEIQAELTRSGAQYLQLNAGEKVFICPRNVKVFLEPGN